MKNSTLYLVAGLSVVSTACSAATMFLAYYGLKRAESEIDQAKQKVEDMKLRVKDTLHTMAMEL